MGNEGETQGNPKKNEEDMKWSGNKREMQGHVGGSGNDRKSRRNEREGNEKRRVSKGECMGSKGK